MKFAKKILVLPEMYVALLGILCLVFLVMAHPSIENVFLTRGGITEKVSFPISTKMEKRETFKVEFEVREGVFGRYDLKIIPDDCVNEMRVNGVSVSLDGIKGLCDFSKGFNFSGEALAPFKNSKRNHFVFESTNNGGPGGMNCLIASESLIYNGSMAISALAFALLCLLLARRLQLKGGLVFVVFVGVLLRCLFFANVPYTQFSNDVDGHVAYVQYIMENKTIPDVDDCWTCYHPPVYYGASVPSFILGEWVGVSGPSAMQLFSLLLSVATLFLGILFLKSFLTGWALGVGGLLWAFWPVMILVAPRIGNDQMFFFFHVLCLWGGVNYLKSGYGKYLILATVSMVLGFYTKSTAVVTMGTFVLFAFFGYIQNIKSLSASRTEKIAWLIFVMFIGGLFVQKFLGDTSLVGNAGGLNSRLKVGTDAFNFLYFDIKTFVTYPFASAWDDEMGRQYFWNYLLKTALFGEFEILRTVTGRTLATITSVSFLGLMVYGIRGFWKTKFETIHWILVLHSAAFFGALMFMRLKYPYACSNDFRYIIPVLLSVIPFISWGITLKESSTKWKILGNGLVLIFVVSAVVLYILAV